MHDVDLEDGDPDGFYNVDYVRSQTRLSTVPSLSIGDTDGGESRRIKRTFIDSGLNYSPIEIRVLLRQNGH